ncbi:MAG: sacsin N-terminal ATP-binding-like domain-containing protein, partial [Halobacteriaceae archaeon]
MSRIEDPFLNRWKGKSAEEQIKQLKKQYEDAPPVAKGAVTGGNKLARGGFSKSHFPLEFIQNADDEGADKIKFEIDENEIRITDNGGGFDFEGIVSVCQQGRSPKDPEEQIGFMGIGFKSIFEVCNRIEVHTKNEDRSKEYHFYFDPSDEIDGIPGNLVPNHLDKEESSDEYDTIVIGDIEEDVDLLGDEGVLSEENLSPTVFLFLNELEEIRIEGARNGREIDRILKRKPSAEEDILENFIAIRDKYIESEGFSGHPDRDVSGDEYVNIRTIAEEDETNWLIF